MFVVKLGMRQISAPRILLQDGFRGFLCLEDMSLKTASSKDAGRYRSQTHVQHV